MADTPNLIDFSVIEGQKENIQSLPGGRSAKALAALYSPSPANNNNNPSDTRNLNDLHRQAFEDEIKASQDSDDPLDVWDRYVKWTFDTYPSAQGTSESQLLPLLERATKAFLASSHYKNDARYLKLWLNYIRFFSDAPRETFAFLARHNIGDGLALFYEEFAAWLEGAGRWNQAEEVYKMGLERQARPQERLLRKFGEFSKRFEHSSEVGGPSSPALPTVRPALVAKVDPFSTSNNPQAPAQRNQGVAGTAAARPSRQKLAIFSDADNAGAPETGSDPAKGWENIGTLKDRRKENTIEARPWNGETLKSETRRAPVLKMAVYKDQSLCKAAVSGNEASSAECDMHCQKSVNPRTGKHEQIVCNLKAVYPCSSDPANELCFDELRMMKRCLDKIQWSKESQPSVTVSREAKSQTKTIQTKLESPTGPRLSKRKVSSEQPTMTFHTRAATDEIYGIFNQPLAKPAAFGEQDTDDSDEEDESDDDDDDDDDYTSVGESTCTGRVDITTKSVSDWSDFSTQRHVPGLDDETEAAVVTDEETHAPYTLTTLIPIAPEDIEGAPRGPYKDAFKASQDRLPFMTPIAEKTESSMGAPGTVFVDKEEELSKTPCRPAAGIEVSSLVEDEELLRSPFREIINEAQPVTETISQLDLCVSKEEPLLPIIEETLCNPLDESIRSKIFAGLAPLFNSYSHFQHSPNDSTTYTADIKRYIKTLSQSKSVSSLLPSAFTLLSCEVKRELGRGAFAPVYLVSSPSKEEEYALKIESSPPSGWWEFYTLQASFSRLSASSPRTTQSVVRAHSLTLTSTESLLLLDYHRQGNLLDAVNSSRSVSATSSDGGLDEALAMFFTVELLRTLESLHDVGIIHGDIKPDNILLRLPSPLIEGDYCPDGSNGWADVGLTLIDFGRSIDTRLFAAGAAFLADWPTGATDCAEMRLARPWTFQADYFGAAGVVFCLLFGRYIETVEVVNAEGKRRERLKDTLKRYWATSEVWAPLFDFLLNPDVFEAKPCSARMQTLRKSAEEWLAREGRRKGLVASLRRFEG